MKLHMLTAAVTALTLAAGAAGAQDVSSEKGKLSYAFGYDLGRNLGDSGESFDMAAVQKGLQEGMAKKQPSVPVEQLRTAVEGFQKRQMAKAKAAFDKASAENKTKSDGFLAQNKAKAGVKTLPSGVQYRVISNGTGAKPTQASQVQINYKASLPDGRTFLDTSKPPQGQPAGPVSLKLSEIPLVGLREALMQMPSGSNWEVVLPPDKAWGNSPQSPIGPNQAVVFDLTLVGVK